MRGSAQAVPTKGAAHDNASVGSGPVVNLGEAANSNRDLAASDSLAGDRREE